MTEIERHQPTEIERQATWEQHANALAARYAGFVSVDDLSPEEKVVSLVSLVPMAMNVVEEARDTIERLNQELAHQRGLLIEALARLEALDMLPGDPGGLFYVRDADDLMMAMRWITAVRTDPPSWGKDEDDPLSRVQDLAMTQAVDARAGVLLGRIRQEMFRYYERVAKRDPERAAKWRPWWRTRK